jgi:hypothetical protein
LLFDGALLGIAGLHAPFTAGTTLLHDAPPILLVHCVDDRQPVHVHGPPLQLLRLASRQSSPPPQSLFARHDFVHVPLVVVPLQTSAPPHVVPHVDAVHVPFEHTPLSHWLLFVHTHTLFVQLPPPHWFFFVHAFMPHEPSVEPLHVYDVFAQSFAV